jgi:hypothetical protein
MVAWGISAKAADAETRIERETRLHCSPCLVQLTGVRQDSRQIEMRIGVISVGFKAPAQPNNRFSVGALPKFGETDPHRPEIDGGITGREAERLLDMGFGFPAPTEKKLRKPDVRVPGPNSGPSPTPARSGRCLEPRGS